MLRRRFGEQLEAPERIEPVEAVEIAADAKALEAGEIARVVVDRQARELDRQMLAAIGRPVHGDPGPGVVAGQRLRHAPLRVEREFRGDLAPGTAEAGGRVRAHQADELAGRQHKAALCIHLPEEAQRMLMRRGHLRGTRRRLDHAGSDRGGLRRHNG
ncbi:hypothetical protein ACVJDU_008794 [Bradyrhizobium diazoefficiens]